MLSNSKYSRPAIVVLCLMLLATSVSAQDLDPRAYARIPVDMTFVVLGFGYTYGGILTDPTLPIEDLNATVESPILGIGHSYSLFGLTSQVFASIPYTWAQLTGLVLGEEKSATRSGLADMKFRFSVLLLGAPAAKINEFAKTPSRTVILGTSLTIVAPVGQYSSDKIINIGTNRWSFKPELGMSYPITKQWLIDIYAGVWLFTNNESYFPGTSVRSQDPLATFQAHISYNVNPLMWAAIDLTYYTGGQSSINNDYNDDRQNNSRIGATVVLPVNKQNSVRLGYSTGAIIRFGANFSTLSISWQATFF